MGFSKEFDNCLYGRTIKEHCCIGDHLDESTTYDENVCISLFVKIDAGNLLDGLRRIANDATARIMT